VVKGGVCEENSAYLKVEGKPKMYQPLWRRREKEEDCRRGGDRRLPKILKVCCGAGADLD